MADDSIESKLERLLGKMESFAELFKELRSDTKSNSNSIAGINREIDNLKSNIKKIEDVDQQQFNVFSRTTDLTRLENNLKSLEGDIKKIRIDLVKYITVEDLFETDERIQNLANSFAAFRERNHEFLSAKVWQIIKLIFSFFFGIISSYIAWKLTHG